jgi:hypothetical protein
MNPAGITLINFAAYAIRLAIVIPMVLLCVAVLIIIPVAASRGKLHIPGYVGIAILAFASGLLSGRLAGVRGIAGHGIAIFLSVAFFVLLAAAMGAIFALFVYRHPSEP